MSDGRDNHTSPNDLAESLTQHIQDLAEATDLAALNDEMLRYLDMCARFHQYSPRNVWLIMMAKPSATQVAGFHRWRSLGRYVRKGERGIPILAPLLVSMEQEDGELVESLVGFKVVYVYDISQTLGEPLPSPPEWKDATLETVLHNRLIQYAKEKGIEVTFTHLRDDVQGLSKGGRIILSPEAGTKTLIHELAHEIMHQSQDRTQTRRIMELEAESVAYVVGRHFDLEGLTSPNYLALYGADSEMILSHLGRIRNTASEIIAALEQV